MIRILLAAVTLLLLLAGCSGGPTGTVSGATVEPTGSGEGAGSTGSTETPGTPGTPGSTEGAGVPGDRPSDVVVRFHRCLGMTCDGGDAMSVTAGGRALSLRKGELVAVTLPRAELRELRAGLTADLAGREGTLDRTEGATDQPFAVVTVVDAAGRTHETRLEGSPTAEDARIVAAIDRLGALTARIRSTGTPDRTGPITVTMYEDPNTRTGREAAWPGDVPTPITSGNHGVREYRGEQAEAVRAALGGPGDEVGVRAGDRVLVARWEAVLP
ncbi:hypothetical protein ACIBCT_04990 [Streptosporangium sp. NPDC050855]|uniref:hypothetical protein n=1 Tax=Streptosporangium sp. NPDC050855 TaxID=3366194 RepID=UPI0037A0173A